VDRVSSTRRPSPEPLEANDQLVAIVISAGWAIALIVLLAVRTQIPSSDRWWIWTCVTGLGLGLFGLVYVPILKRSRARTAARRAQSRADSSAAH
jgi:H+/Cl- antiporter ClcA